MAFDSPSLGGYAISNPPENMNIFWESVTQLNELADGGFRQRILGYRLRAELTWDNNWIRSQDLTGLMAVANSTTATLTFIPRPSTYPTRSFVVLWTDKFQFQAQEGRFGVYSGKISLVSPNVTSTISDLP